MEKITSLSHFVNILDKGTQIFTGEALVPMTTELLKCYTIETVERLIEIGHLNYEPNSTAFPLVRYAVINESPNGLFDIYNDDYEVVECHFQTYKKAYNYAKRIGYVVVDSFE